MVLEADREIRPVGGRKGGERGFSTKSRQAVRGKNGRDGRVERGCAAGRRGRGGGREATVEAGSQLWGETEVGRGLPRMGVNVENEAISRESMRDARGLKDE